MSDCKICNSSYKCVACSSKFLYSDGSGCFESCVNDPCNFFKKN